MDNPNRKKQYVAGAVVAVMLTALTFYITDFQRITMTVNNVYDSVNSRINGDVSDKKLTNKG